MISCKILVILIIFVDHKLIQCVQQQQAEPHNNDKHNNNHTNNNSKNNNNGNLKECQMSFKTKYEQLHN